MRLQIIILTLMILSLRQFQMNDLHYSIKRRLKFDVSDPLNP